MEIEKKYLVDFDLIGFSLENYQSSLIEQYYISLNPEVRFRKIDSKFFITVKGSGDMIRTEVEHEIDEELFKKMKNCIIGHVISKRRYFIPINDKYLCELDIYSGELQGLITAEIEFGDEKSAEEIKNYLPVWIKEDITFDKKYKNKSLSQFTKNEVPR